MPRLFLNFCLVLLLAGTGSAAMAQELEPRRWSHLPDGGHFLGGGLVVTEGDIVFDPVLRVEDVEVDMDTWALKYIYSFELFNKSARISLLHGHQNGVWSGLLDGVPTKIQRVGLTDSVIRFAINLMGAPPLSGPEYQTYRSAQANETIVGLGVAVQLPTGEYLDDKLINLGTNRYTFRPQLGLVHSRGDWSYEVTGAVWLYSDNDDFFGGNNLEQDPFFFLQGHVIRSLQPGRWAGLSVGYGIGGETTINGLEKDDRKKNLAWAISYGFALSPTTALKLAYAGTRTKTSTGLDSGSLAILLSASW